MPNNKDNRDNQDNQNYNSDIYSLLDQLLEEGKDGVKITNSIIELIINGKISISDPKVLRALAEKLPADKLHDIQNRVNAHLTGSEADSGVKSRVGFSKHSESEHASASVDATPDASPEATPSSSKRKDK